MFSTIVIFIFSNIFTFNFLFAATSMNDLNNSKPKSVGTADCAGQISFNGQVTSAIKCLAAVDGLGETVKGNDMQFGRKICVDQKGGGPRCYMEKKSAKEKPKQGGYLISTGQNSGGGGCKDGANQANQNKVDSNQISNYGPSAKSPIINTSKEKAGPSAQKEMEKKKKSCCTKIGKGPKTSHDCLQTKGDPAEETGGLEGGNTKGNDDGPSQNSPSPLELFKKII